MTQATILLADNHEDFLRVRKTSLEQAGYKVSTASNPIEARQLLSRTHFDLAIIDIRLEDNLDEKDISGLILARDCAPSVPKIMLTDYPSLETDFSVRRLWLALAWISARLPMEAHIIQALGNLH